MRPRALLLLAIPATLALLGACKKDDGETPSTTTIRSGTPGGPRVTNVTGFDEGFDPASRLAGAICRRERECAAARRLMTDEALLLKEAACVGELQPSTRLSMQQLDCSPGAARAGFEECLAAIGSEPCSASTSNYPQLIPACRPSAMCR